ncbi:hypothetical protein VUR80DRAFT_5797 [Thermomyces stellatus]
MSGSYSPYTRSGYSDDPYYNSPSPTPSPRPSPYMYGQHYHQRPATRAHFRTPSHTRPETTRPSVASPRFTSDGQYATKSTNVSAHYSSPMYSPSTPPMGGRHTRRSSVSDVRSSPGIQKVKEFDGVYYVVGPDFKSTRRSGGGGATYSSLRHATDHPDWQQGGYGGRTYARDAYAREEFAGSQTPRPTHTRRRSSMSMPQRPATARPSASQQTEIKPGAISRPATELDRAKHKIPKGYSLKNWDPSETPILLLGSVFHADSLGKWIYDWTVYAHGSTSASSSLAADLWLYLIQFGGYMKAAEEVCNQVRSRRNRALVEEYLNAGDRISERLRDLLKRCEAPMLKASKQGAPALGKNSGVEFVETLFSPDRELERTKRFVDSLENWVTRYNANCEHIVQNPYM